MTVLFWIFLLVGLTAGLVVGGASASRLRHRNEILDNTPFYRWYADLYDKWGRVAFVVALASLAVAALIMLQIESNR